MRLKIFSCWVWGIAGALLALCTPASGEFVQGERADCFYVRTSIELPYGNEIIREIAFEQAQLDAQEEFIRCAVLSRMTLPKELEPLWSLIEKYPISSRIYGKIVGMEFICFDVLKDKRVNCIFRIPRHNLENFLVSNFRDCPEKVLEFFDFDPVMEYEVLARIGKADLESLFREAFPRVARMKSGKIFSIPQTWLFEKLGPSADGFDTLSSQQLVELWVSACGEDSFVESIAKVLANRGLTESAEQLGPISFPVKDESPRGVEFLKSIGLKGSSVGENFLKYGCAVAFSKSNVRNSDLSSAKKEFSKKQPDYKKMVSLLERSLASSISDESLNLLGRGYEALGDNFSAAVVYAQAISLNPRTAYARANYAEMLFRLGSTKDAECWANAVVTDKQSNEWALKRCRSLLGKIRQTASKESVIKFCENFREESESKNPDKRTQEQISVSRKGDNKDTSSKISLSKEF